MLGKGGGHFNKEILSDVAPKDRNSTKEKMLTLRIQGREEEVMFEPA